MTFGLATDRVAQPRSRKPRPASATPPSQWRRRLSRAATGWAFAGPATVIVIGLSIFPAAWAFLISRTKWNGFTPATNVGWRNYQTMAQDPELSAAVGHTLVLTALFVPSSILLGMLIAVALNRSIKFVAFYRTCIFVPYVASAAATGILASFVFNPQFGIANDALRRLHLPTQQFLESHTQALTVICIIALWGEVGFTAVIYLAALQDIPKDLLEAAAVDGAGRIRTFWHVTLPQLRAGDGLRRGLAVDHSDPAVRPRLHHDPRRATAVHRDRRLLHVRPRIQDPAVRLRLGGRLRSVRLHHAAHARHLLVFEAIEGRGVLMASQSRRRVRRRSAARRSAAGTCC